MNNRRSPLRIDPKDHFMIGGEDILLKVFISEEADGDASVVDDKKLREVLEEIRIRIGILLKTETVSFLLGAGASVDCGGQLIGSVPVVAERKLHEEGISGRVQLRVRKWLKVFYLAARRASDVDGVPVERQSILERHDALNRDNPEPIRVNYEEVLSILHRWRSAIPEQGGRLRLDGPAPVDVTADDLAACLTHAKRALAQACDLPTSANTGGLEDFKTLLRKLLTRPLNLKRVNVFTLNYDTLVEQASDAEGVVLLDGFVGTERRIFRPESYEQDLYFPAETTEGRVHRFDRVLHLYKLHGSITWVSEEPTLDNPYGVRSKTFDPQTRQPLLIYPTPTKHGETLGMPYSELFRRFATGLVRPQSVLFVVGYGFGDDHVNAIIRQALALPSFTLVVVDPKPQSDFVKNLRAQNDTRVWIAEGESLGKLSGFIAHILPDLRDEDVQRKVLAPTVP